MNLADTETAYIWFIKQGVIIYIVLQLEQDPWEENQLIKQFIAKQSLYILQQTEATVEYYGAIQKQSTYHHH